MRQHNNHGFWPWLFIFLALPVIDKVFSFGVTISVICFAISVLSGIILIQGITIISNKPPYFGIVERFKVRIWDKDDDGDPIVVVVTEGWNWVFLKGFYYGVIPMNKSKREIDFPEQILQTPDGATTRVKVSLAYSPLMNEIINLLNLGTDDPFKVFENMIKDIKEEKLRIWARDTKDGPQTWEDLISSSEAAVKLLLESICNEIMDSEAVKQIRAGYGKWNLIHFGITLNRLNLTEMEPFGEVYEASLKKKDEIQERDAETFELETDINKALLLVNKMKSLGTEISFSDALKQIMEWKITREANSKMSLSALAQQIFKAAKTN